MTQTQQIDIWTVLVVLIFPTIAAAFWLLWGRMNQLHRENRETHLEHERLDLARFAAMDKTLEEQMQAAERARERLRDMLGDEAKAIRQEIMDSRHLTMNTVQSIITKTEVQLDRTLSRIEDRLDKMLDNGKEER